LVVVIVTTARPTTAPVGSLIVPESEDPAWADRATAPRYSKSAKALSLERRVLLFDAKIFSKRGNTYGDNDRCDISTPKDIQWNYEALREAAKPIETGH
jgi:hypothetical protein